MSIRTTLALALAGALLAACAATAPPVEPTAIPPAPGPQPTVEAAAGPALQQSDDEIKAGIQQSLDLLARAYNQNSPDLLEQAVDQTNPPFRRLIATRLETYQQSILAGGRYDYVASKIVARRDYGFVVARVELWGVVFDWTFRQVDGRWVMSEPTEQQIGQQHKSETDHFVFYAYPWSDNVNPKIMELMEQARGRVLERLGRAPDQKPAVYIRPIFGVGGIASSNRLAYYDRDDRAGDRIVIYAPESYVFSYYDPAVGWEQTLLATLVHEYTHLVNHRSFTPLGRMSDWMVEGLAEYVSDSARADEVAQAVRSDAIIPIMDTTGRVYKQDLQHLAGLEKDVSLAYGLAASLVAYIAERHGGLEGFWKLVRAYDKAQNLDTALRQAFGVSYEQFDQGWREWLAKQYG